MVNRVRKHLLTFFVDDEERAAIWERNYHFLVLT